MGTETPPVTTSAATLAGGTNNQDRYVIGDDFAIVLDGATALADDRSHDAGWFAEKLGGAIADRLSGTRPLPEVVESAIRDVRDVHGLTPATSPTSTVAIARWSGENVESYALGDSSVILLMSDGSELVCTDRRLSAIAPEIRDAYRQRLAAGHSFDETHAKLLTGLQRYQAEVRNTPEGYWIAGADPEAGRHGLSWVNRAEEVRAVVLASDGVSLSRHPCAGSWAHIYDRARCDGAASVLHLIHAAEESDPDGVQSPRSKYHDDKTLVIVERPVTA